MIVQACLNGARPRRYHPALPLTAEAMAVDAAACVAAGAAELHVHPRGPDGRESLAAVGPTVLALRKACPGTLIGVSTGAWIEGEADRTLTAIAAWQACPDYASVNLAEPEAPAVIDALMRRGVGIEAGLSCVADAERFAALQHSPRVFRILIEVEDQEVAQAYDMADRVDAVLGRGAVGRPILAHGLDATVWALVDRARTRRWSTRIGLEDGDRLPDGTTPLDNAALVAAACALLRGS